jgi:hypothetical protein
MIQFVGVVVGRADEVGQDAELLEQFGSETGGGSPILVDVNLRSPQEDPRAMARELFTVAFGA